MHFSHISLLAALLSLNLHGLANTTTLDTTTVSREKLSGPDNIIAHTIIKAPVAQLLPVLERPCHVQQWMPDIIEIRLLENDGRSGQRVYMRSRGSLISQPRDAISYFTRTSEQPLIITMESEPAALPEQPDTVRIPFAHARWSLLPLDVSTLGASASSSTLVEYRQRVAAGGRIPQWAADYYSLRHVERALEALKKYVASLSTTDCPVPMQP